MKITGKMDIYLRQSIYIVHGKIDEKYLGGDNEVGNLEQHQHYNLIFKEK